MITFITLCISAMLADLIAQKLQRQRTEHSIFPASMQRQLCIVHLSCTAGMVVIANEVQLICGESLIYWCCDVT
jgi:hypothetical protein